MAALGILVWAAPGRGCLSNVGADRIQRACLDASVVPDPPQLLIKLPAINRNNNSVKVPFHLYLDHIFPFLQEQDGHKQNQDNEELEPASLW